jgi:alpha-beta hydrolase superfamily lysophospholipase
MADEVNLRITGFEPGDEIAGARRITIGTTRGPIALLMHAAAGEPGRAALCLSGAIGGFDGPALLYPRLGLELPRKGISVARLDYREPDEFGECLLDAMAALTFLRGIGYQRTAVLGHSFGAAVAINAGTLGPAVSTVIALSSQLAGAHVVAEVAPRPLLLIHGTADTILPHQSSEMLYERAREPKRIKLLAGAGHGLSEAADEVFADVEAWLLEKA